MEPLICILILGFGVFALLRHARTCAEKYPSELVFVIGYLGFFICYSYQEVAFFFTRFMIPVYPFLLFAAREWLPKNRIISYLDPGVLSSLIASTDLVGFKTVFGISFHS